jgi:hypothetical protein
LFLHYLQERHVAGLIGWAFDMPGTLVRKFGADGPTTLEGEVCGARPPVGAGAWVQAYFRGTLPPL